MFSEKDKYRKFRAYLKKLMDKCQLTAYGLGQISKLDPTFLRRILSGQRNPSRRTVLKIAASLRDYSTVITDRDIELLIKVSGFPLREISNIACNVLDQ